MTDVSKPITTLEDKIAGLEAAGWLGEVVNGAFVEETELGGEEHGHIEANLIGLLWTFTRPNNMGRIYPGATMFILGQNDAGKDVARRPDVAFVAHERVIATVGAARVGPDVAVEIVSQSEDATDIEEKLADYLRFGVRLAWQVYLKTRHIVVTQPDGTSFRLYEDDTLTGGDVLPGLEVKVREIFDDQPV